MPCLNKCDLSNMSINEDGNVIALVLVSTQSQRTHPMFKKQFVNLNTGETGAYQEIYNSRSPCFNDYRPLGVMFKGKLSEYGSLSIEFDEENIFNLGIFVNATQIEIESGKYDPKLALEYFNKGEYNSCWNVINSSVSVYDNTIYMDTHNGVQPVHFTYIREDVFNSLHTNTMQNKIFNSIFYYYERELNLKERLDKVPEFLDSIIKAQGKYDFIEFFLPRVIENTYLIGDGEIITGRYSKELVSDTMISQAMANYDRGIEEKPIDKEFYINILKNVIKIEYIVSCYEYFNACFKRQNIVSSEDYQNYHSNEYFEFLKPLYEADQLHHDSYEGYQFLIEKVSAFSSNRVELLATYLEGGDIEKMIENCGEIPKEIVTIIENAEYRSNDVLVYDKTIKEFYIIEDHEFIENKILLGDIEDNV